MSGGKIIGTKLIITPALATLERQHNRYLANLPVWDQYVVWTYTLGSQPVNRLLISMPVSPKSAVEWTFHLFENFQQFKVKDVGKDFKFLIELFKDPSAYRKLPDELKNNIANIAITRYSKNLQRIIIHAPVTVGDITVYKASTPYDLKLTQNDFPFTLVQVPFNSTTYDPWFDFAAFLGSSEDTCCLWQISIPKGSRILAITHPFQAYLTEREILLPYDSTFEVIGSKDVQMSYYNTKDEPIKTQEPPFSIGEVYRHDNWIEKTQSVRIVRMLLANFRN